MKSKLADNILKEDICMNDSFLHRTIGTPPTKIDPSSITKVKVIEDKVE